MNLLATDLVESGDADDGGSDGAEDEAAGNHGKKGVLEGRGDGSLGDEGVGERGGGARDHGGGELLDLGAVGTGRGWMEDGSENIHSCASWQRLPRASGRRIRRAQLDASFVDP